MKSFLQPPNIWVGKRTTSVLTQQSWSCGNCQGENVCSTSVDTCSTCGSRTRAASVDTSSGLQDACTGVACLQCTFINENSQTKCEICDASLPSSHGVSDKIDSSTIKVNVRDNIITTDNERSNPIIDPNDTFLKKRRLPGGNTMRSNGVGIFQQLSASLHSIRALAPLSPLAQSSDAGCVPKTGNSFSDDTNSPPRSNRKLQRLRPVTSTGNDVDDCEFPSPELTRQSLKPKVIPMSARVLKEQSGRYSSVPQNRMFGNSVKVDDAKVVPPVKEHVANVGPKDIIELIDDSDDDICDSKPPGSNGSQAASVRRSLTSKSVMTDTGATFTVSKSHQLPGNKHRSGDTDSYGSLEDFIVNDEEDEDYDSDGDASYTSDGTHSASEVGPEGDTNNFDDLIGGDKGESSMQFIEHRHQDGYVFHSGAHEYGGDGAIRANQLSHNTNQHRELRPTHPQITSHYW